MHRSPGYSLRRTLSLRPWLSWAGISETGLTYRRRDIYRHTVSAGAAWPCQPDPFQSDTAALPENGRWLSQWTDTPGPAESRFGAVQSHA